MTYLSRISYPRLSGGQTNFPVTFPYLDQAHVGVYVGEAGSDPLLAPALVPGVDYTWTSAGMVRTTVAHDGSDLHVRRSTPPTVDNISGGTLSANTQNRIDRQLLYVTQEAIDSISDNQVALSASLRLGFNVGTWPALMSKTALSGKYLAFDLSGNPIPSNGTGADGALRSDLAAATGASLVTYTQPGTGAMKRTALDKARETTSVRDFGAIGDGVDHLVAEWIIPGARGRYASLAALQVDYPHVTSTAQSIDWAAFQAVANYGMSLPNGLTAIIPPGSYKFTGQVTQDRSSNSALGVVNFRGAGRSATLITHNGATAAFSFTGHATASEGQTLYPELSGMTLLGSSLPNEVGIGMTLVSFAALEDILLAGFDYAFYLQDVDHTSFNAIEARWNVRGLLARQNPTPVANSTQPNQFTFNECVFNNNSLYGLYNRSGVNWTFSGGSIENNGWNDSVNGFGIKFDQAGYQGGSACEFIGTYFESNNGVADVVLVQDITTSPVVTQATYNFFGCSFNRTRATGLAPNNIVCNFASPANVGDQILNLVGCTFKSYNSYVPSSSRPYIAYIGAGQPRSHINFTAIGCVFKDAVEAPPFVQRVTRPFAELSKSGNQSFANGTPTIWQLDTVGFGFSWSTTINGSFQIAIPEAGNYQFSASVTFQVALANSSRLEILKGAAGIASNTLTGVDTLTASTTKYCAAGELISVRVTQNSGAAATLAGSASATSYLNIQKLMDA